MTAENLTVIDKCKEIIILTNRNIALPHDEVESSEFYKHIENGLPEPRRMKQLLTWCGTRALGEKPSSTSEDFNAGFAGMFDALEIMVSLD